MHVIDPTSTSKRYLSRTIDATLLTIGILSVVFGAALMLLPFTGMIFLLELHQQTSFEDISPLPLPSNRWLSTFVLALGVPALVNGLIISLKELGKRRSVFAMMAINIAALSVFGLLLLSEGVRFSFVPVVGNLVFLVSFFVALLAVAWRSPNALRLFRRAGPWEA